MNGGLDLSGMTTLRRQLKVAKIVRTRVLEFPLGVLLIMSRPSDTGFIDQRNSIPSILFSLTSNLGVVYFECC